MSRTGNIALYIFVIVVALLIACLFALYMHQSNQYNNFVEDCNREGGVVQLTERNFPSERYECVKEGKVKRLEGWQDA